MKFFNEGRIETKIKTFFFSTIIIVLCILVINESISLLILNLVIYICFFFFSQFNNHFNGSDGYLGAELLRFGY